MAKKKFYSKVELADYYFKVTNEMIKNENPNLSELELMLIFPTHEQDLAFDEILRNEGYDLDDLVEVGKYSLPSSH